MKGNIIPELTWRWMKANDTLIEIPEIEKKSFNLYEENIVEDKVMDREFVDKDYGVSNELLEINEEYRNWDNYVESEEDFYKINLSDVIFLNDRQRIHLKKGEKKTIIYDYYQDDNKETFRNSIFELLLEEDSELNLFITQRLGNEALSFISLIGNVNENAHINLVSLDLGAKEAYINFLGNLKEENATFNIKSSYIGILDSKLDIAYEMRHLYKKTNSNMELAGVLKDRSKKRFIGTLDFKKGSVGSIGSEEEVVTLLNDEVKSKTIPLLLSHESDIVGEHAASAGRIDEEMLYYIMTRGFSETEAKTLIVESRINPVVDLIPNEELKNEIKNFVRKGILY